jgi:DNA-directed RNA polymerase specialized sigma54-like protein
MLIIKNVLLNEVSKDNKMKLTHFKGINNYHPLRTQHALFNFLMLSQQAFNQALITAVNENPLLEIEEVYLDNVIVPTKIDHPEEDNNTLDEYIILNTIYFNQPPNYFTAMDMDFLTDLWDGSIQSGRAKTKAPDIIADYEGNQWTFSMHESCSKIIIHQENLKTLFHHRHRPRIRYYLKEKMLLAKQLFKKIELRNKILTLITQLALKNQTDFIKGYGSIITPIPLKNLAKLMDIPEKNLCKIIANKTLQTPRGNFPLSLFFKMSASRQHTLMGNKKRIFRLIHDIIARESPRKPLSDQQIANKLKKDYELNIARRTISQYREHLGILSSKLRNKISLHDAK